MLEQFLKLGRDFFLLRPFQFLIHPSIQHCNLSNSVVTKKKQQQLAISVSDYNKQTGARPNLNTWQDSLDGWSAQRKLFTYTR